MFDWELVVERLDRIREMIEKIQARSAFVKTSDDFQSRIKLVEKLCSSEPIGKETVAQMIENLSLPASVQVLLLDYSEIVHDVPMYRMLGPVVKALLPEVYQAFVHAYTQTTIPAEWSESIDSAIMSLDGNIDVSIMRDIRQIVVTQYLLNESSNVKSYNEWRQRGVV